MSIEDEARKILLKTGLWWPEAGSGKLRDAATAWRTFADAVDDVRGPCTAAPPGPRVGTAFISSKFPGSTP
ncbi:hypothetical protein [Streptomyces sp. SID8499]|uniref:hypothetical protein n=1 Tax=Streptomyces sp. SID8499 TaxID=2706106 RepID=UPI0013C9C5D0|nr:hypothetical protein [Streptomyces sp. SID8499]NED35237.1 hypothetical protein [Streptomyces sp. SID8499]